MRCGHPTITGTLYRLYQQLSPEHTLTRAPPQNTEHGYTHGHGRHAAKRPPPRRRLCTAPRILCTRFPVIIIIVHTVAAECTHCAATKPTHICTEHMRARVHKGDHNKTHKHLTPLQKRAERARGRASSSCEWGGGTSCEWVRVGASGGDGGAALCSRTMALHPIRLGWCFLNT